MTMIESSERFDMGRVVQRTFAPIGANFVVFFALALLFSGVPTFVMGLVQQWVLEQNPGIFARPEFNLAIVTTSIAGFLVTFILSLMLQATIVRASIMHLNGDRPDFVDSLRASLGLLLPLIGMAILVNLAVVLGLILLVVPGIILVVMWCVAVPALVEERQGIISSLARSGALTKGSRWKIFALFLIAVIIVFLISVVFGLVALSARSGTFSIDSAGSSSSVFWLLVEAIFSSISGLIAATGIAAIYIELRTIKEGATPSSLAAIFE